MKHHKWNIKGQPGYIEPSEKYPTITEKSINDLIERLINTPARNDSALIFVPNFHVKGVPQTIESVQEFVNSLLEWNREDTLSAFVFIEGLSKTNLISEKMKLCLESILNDPNRTLLYVDNEEHLRFLALGEFNHPII